MPMRKHPVTFTRSVPTGNDALLNLWAAPPARYRRTLPVAPPRAIHRSIGEKLMRHSFECGGPGLARNIGMMVKTETQVSAGGAAFRKTATGLEVALISVGNPPRWQLPKGLVDSGETPEVAAVREVREEAGIAATSAGL